MRIEYIIIIFQIVNVIIKTEIIEKCEIGNYCGSTPCSVNGYCDFDLTKYNNDLFFESTDNVYSASSFFGTHSLLLFILLSAGKNTYPYLHLSQIKLLVHEMQLLNTLLQSPTWVSFIMKYLVLFSTIFFSVHTPFLLSNKTKPSIHLVHTMPVSSFS